MSVEGIAYITNRYPNLLLADEAEGAAAYLRRAGDKIPNEPRSKAAAYLGFLAHKELVNDGVLTGDRESIERQVGAHVIAEKDVSSALIAQRYEGYVQGVQAEQEAYLQEWAQHISSEKAGFPDWFKYFAFEGVKVLGGFDEKKETYSKRSATTIVPVPELNKVALTYMYRWVDAYSRGDFHMPEHLSDGIRPELKQEKFKKDIAHGRFGELYATALNAAAHGGPTQERLRVTTGEWQTFKDLSEADEVVKKLRGKGVRWCVTLQTHAKTYLQSGELRIFFSHDEEGEPTVPRIAVAYDRQGKPKDIKGIDIGQNIEPRMLDILKHDLKSRPGTKLARKTIRDSKRFQAVKDRLQQDPDAELSNDELRLMYELNQKCRGFGSDAPVRTAMERWRNGRDKEAIVSLLPELISEYMPEAARVYAELQQIFPQVEVLAESEILQLWQEKCEEWKVTGVLDYVRRHIQEKGGWFVPIILPNVEVEGDQLIQAVKMFSARHKRTVEVDLHLMKCVPRLAPEKSAAPVRFSLMPTSGELISSAQEQAILVQKSYDDPMGPRLHAPNLLETVAYWSMACSKKDLSRKYGAAYISHCAQPIDHPVFGADARLVSALGNDSQSYIRVVPANRLSRTTVRFAIS